MDSNEYRAAEAKLNEVINQQYEAQLAALEIQEQINQLELDHLAAIKEEFDARNAIIAAYQSIEDTRISNLKARGQGQYMGDATYSNEIRESLLEKYLKQLWTTQYTKDEYAEYQAQYQNVVNTFGKYSTEAQEAYATLIGIEKQILESENAQFELQEEIRQTYVNEFNKMVDATERTIRAIESLADIETSLAELYKSAGEYQYESGLGDMTYFDDIKKKMEDALTLDYDIVDERKKLLEASYSRYADIWAQYGKDNLNENVMNARTELFNMAKSVNDAERKIIEDKMAIDQLEIDRANAIKEKFDSYSQLYESILSSSKAMVNLYTEMGRKVSAGGGDNGKQEEIRSEMTGQLERQRAVSGMKALEFSKYYEQMVEAGRTFGKDSNQYRSLETQLAGIGTELIESKKAEYDLKHQIAELDFTYRHYVIENIKKFIDKLVSFTSLAEKRGTNPVYGYQVTEKLYADQIKENNKLAERYMELRDARAKQIQDEIKAGELQYGSERYQELYGAISDAEEAIVNLAATNEDLKASVRSLRWKPFEDLKKQINDIISDYNHLRSFIREDEMYDKQGQYTERGYANIALIGGDIDEQTEMVAAAEAAIQKLDEEYKNGTINLETYNEELDTQINLIQSATEAIYEDQQALANMKVEQWQREVDVLNELIEKRQEALSQKKA